MDFKLFRVLVLVFLGLVFISPKCQAQETKNEQHISVALRMIGHGILLDSGDSTSRVLPVEKVGGRYKIPFESEFQFNPGLLANRVDSIITKTKIAERYIVEVEECDSSKVVYSYEMGVTYIDNIIPCGPRDQPKDCYGIFISILDEPLIDESVANSSDKGFVFGMKFFKLTMILLFLLILLILYLRHRTKNSPESIIVNPNMIEIGEYKFDKMTSELHLEDQKIELTSKESDLLLLLYNSANTTIDRDVILKNVWGDDGDYVGRTLDVFISKLRKKLEVDTRVKIVNIRGVGYKLVLNVPVKP